MEKIWEFKENGIDCDETCPHIKNREIVLTNKVMNKIKALCIKCKNLEWMAMLKGKITNEEILIEDISVPEQEASVSRIKLTNKGDKESQSKEYIGWIHSHNTMSVFFSKEDIRTASQNDVSIVTNNKLEFLAVVREKLPCGHKILAQVKVTNQLLIDKKFIKELEDKIIEPEVINTKKYETQSTVSTYNEHKKEWEKVGGDKCGLCERAIECGEDYALLGSMKAHADCIEEMYFNQSFQRDTEYDKVCGR